MIHRFMWPMFGVIFVAALGLEGCAPVPGGRSEISSTLQMPSTVVKSEGAGRESTAFSSLDALRKGQAPASGPLSNIYFDFDRYDLREDAREMLKANAEWLRANPIARVQIEGHCDERGTNEYNLALGSKRAKAAREYLITLGISPQRVSTISYGEELPACKDRTEECWQKNRRARFVVSAQSTS